MATWNGTALVWADGPALATNSTTGTYLSQATCDPAGSSVIPNYYGSGTITTTDIRIPSARPTSSTRNARARSRKAASLEMSMSAPK